MTIASVRICSRMNGTTPLYMSSSVIEGGEMPTGGQPQPNAGNGQNGHENQGGDRFPLHRRRRRGHRGPRPDMAGGISGEAADEGTPPAGE